MKYHLLILVICIVGEVNCDQFETIYKELQNIEFHNEEYQEVEGCPTILYKNGKLFATVSVVTGNSSLEVYIEYPESKIPVVMKSKGNLYFGEYQATRINNNGVAVILRSTVSVKDRKVPQISDRWEMFVNDKQNDIDKVFNLEPNRSLSDPNAYFQSVHLEAYDSGEFKLLIKRFNFDLFEVRGYLQSPLMSYFEHYKMKSGVIKHDDYSGNYYRIDYLNSTNAIIDVLKWRTVGKKFEFQVETKGNIDEAPQAIAIESNHVTFCFSYNNNRKVLTCKLFDIASGKKINDLIEGLEFGVKKIFVKNLEQIGHSLVFYVEDSGDNMHNVFVTIAHKKLYFDPLKLLSTKSKIDYIHYDITPNVFEPTAMIHCLTIGLIDRFRETTIKRACFKITKA